MHNRDQVIEFIDTLKLDLMIEGLPKKVPGHWNTLKKNIEALDSKYQETSSDKSYCELLNQIRLAENYLKAKDTKENIQKSREHEKSPIRQKWLEQYILHAKSAAAKHGFNAKAFPSERAERDPEPKADKKRKGKEKEVVKCTDKDSLNYDRNEVIAFANAILKEGAVTANFGQDVRDKSSWKETVSRIDKFKQSYLKHPKDRQFFNAFIYELKFAEERFVKESDKVTNKTVLKRQLQLGQHIKDAVELAEKLGIKADLKPLARAAKDNEGGRVEQVVGAAAEFKEGVIAGKEALGAGVAAASLVVKAVNKSREAHGHIKNASDNFKNAGKNQRENHNADNNKKLPVSVSTVITHIKERITKLDNGDNCHTLVRLSNFVDVGKEKADILTRLVNDLECCVNLVEKRDYIHSFKVSDEYKTLNAARGKVTAALQSFSLFGTWKTPTASLVDKLDTVLSNALEKEVKLSKKVRQ